MIKPLTNRVVIKPEINQTTQTKSGIVLPGQKNPKASMIGEIISVGPEVEGVVVGDRVIFIEEFFETYVSNPEAIKDEQIKFQIGKVDDILAILETDN